MRRQVDILFYILATRRTPLLVCSCIKLVYMMTICFIRELALGLTLGGNPCLLSFNHSAASVESGHNSHVENKPL